MGPVETGGLSNVEVVLLGDVSVLAGSVRTRTTENIWSRRLKRTQERRPFFKKLKLIAVGTEGRTWCEFCS